MNSSNETLVGTRLIESLREIKNPIVVFFLGILFGVTFYFKNIETAYFLAFSVISLLLFFIIRRKEFLIFVMSLAIGFFYPNYYTKFFQPNLDGLLNKKNIFIGEILSGPDNGGLFYRKYFFKIKDVVSEDKTVNNVNCKVQVFGSRYEEYDVGDTVQITGVLKKPKNALFPGFYDEKQYLSTKNVNYILKADNGSLVFLDAPSGTDLKRKINNLRKHLVSVNNKLLPNKQAHIVHGIVFGSKASKLPEGLEEKIQSLGISHITSASGFNVSILACGVFFLFRLIVKNRFIPTVVSIFAVLLYSAIADFSSSIIRAAIFVVLVLVGNLFDKKLKILPGISLITVGFFIANPVNILDIGLQLSILAFLGLVLFSDCVNIDNFFNVKMSKWLLSLIVQSFFAQIMVIPLIVFYFHNIQLLGLISNLVAVPLASLILILGLISVLFSFIPYFSFFISYFLFSVSDLFLDWVNFLNKAPIKELFLPNLNFYFLILIYGLITFLLCSVFLKIKKNWFWIVLTCFVALFFTVYGLTDTSKYLKVLFLPKYNKDVFLLVYPHEKPIYFTSRIDEGDIRQIKTYLKLNNFPPRLRIYNLNQTSFPSKTFLEELKGKVVIKYGDFSCHILKNYNEKVTDSVNLVKLPILKKDSPPLSSILLSLPEVLIVNDYKRLSKKSIKDIQWLKSQNTMSFFLSETGTITLVSDSSGYKIDTAE